MTALFFTSFVSAGDVLEIGTSWDLLELREPIGDVRTTITSAEMPNFLAGGVINTNQGSTAFNQYLRFLDSSNPFNSPLTNYTENQGIADGFVSDYLYIQDSDNPTNPSTAFMEFELEFESGLESIISSSRLPDLINVEFNVLGEEYIVFDNMVDTTNDEVTLILLAGRIREYMQEGQIETYTIDGKDYTVNVMVIGSNPSPSVILEVNGEILIPLQNGQTTVIGDGSIVAVNNIILNPGGIDVAEIYIGANKLVLKDTTYTDTTYSQYVEINGAPITNALVQIIAAEQSSATKLEISTIKYRLSADALNGDDVWVNAGHGVREYLDEPQGMLGFDWDIRYEGLDDVPTSIIKLDPSGDDEYKLIFENKQGLVYNVPFLSNEGNFKYGTDDRDLVFEEGIYNATAKNAADHRPTVGHLDYFVLSDVDEVNGYDGQAISHIMRYGNYDAQNNELKFEDMATGETRLVTYSTTSPVNGTLGSGDLNVGGTTYKVYVANASSGIPPLIIDQNADGIKTDSAEVRITIEGRGIIDLGDHTSSTGGTWTNNNGTNNTGTWSNTGEVLTIPEVVFNVTTLATSFDEGGPITNSNHGVEWTAIKITPRNNNEIGLNYSSFDGSFNSNGGIISLLEDEGNNNYYSGMTDYGALWSVYDSSLSNNPETLTIEYPFVQRGVEVFIRDYSYVPSGISVSIDSPCDGCIYSDDTILLIIDASASNGLHTTWYDYNGSNVVYGGPIFLDLEGFYSNPNGGYTLNVWANDTLGNVEGNTSTFFMALPDLLISEVSHSPANPEVGDLVTIDLTLLNNGTDLNGSFNWVYDFDYGNNINSFSLNSGDSLNLSFSHNYTEGGDYTFYFEVDPTNAIEELNEDNNVLLYDIFIDGTTDLNPVLISKKKDPNNRNNVILTYRINNFGNVYAENFDYNVLYGDGTGTGGIISNRIDPNGHYDFNLTHEYNTLGIYDISFEVDSMNMFVEFNETNNLVETKVRIPCDKRIPGSITRCAPKKR